MLSAEEKIAIVNYRRQKSHESLNEAKEVIKLGFWSLAGNRLYYAAFHMASALLLDKGITARSHSGVIHLIGAQFVTKGLLEKEYGRLFSRLFEMRKHPIKYTIKKGCISFQVKQPSMVVSPSFFIPFFPFVWQHL